MTPIRRGVGDAYRMRTRPPHGPGGGARNLPGAGWLSTSLSPSSGDEDAVEGEGDGLVEVGRGDGAIGETPAVEDGEIAGP